jgi:hypothetical protein
MSTRNVIHERPTTDTLATWLEPPERPVVLRLRLRS